MRNEQLLTDAESKRRRAERLRQIAPGITRLPDWKMLLDQADQLDEEALRLEAEAANRRPAHFASDDFEHEFVAQPLGLRRE